MTEAELIMQIEARFEAQLADKDKRIDELQKEYLDVCQRYEKAEKELAETKTALGRSQAARNTNADDRDAALAESDQLRAQVQTLREALGVFTRAHSPEWWLSGKAHDIADAALSSTPSTDKPSSPSTGRSSNNI